MVVVGSVILLGARRHRTYRETERPLVWRAIADRSKTCDDTRQDLWARSSHMQHTTQTHSLNNKHYTTTHVAEVVEKQLFQVPFLLLLPQPQFPIPIQTPPSGVCLVALPESCRPFFPALPFCCRECRERVRAPRGEPKCH